MNTYPFLIILGLMPLWLAFYVYLLFTVLDPHTLLALGGLGVVSLVALTLKGIILRKNREHFKKLDLFLSAASSASGYLEMIFLDEYKEVIFSTHPNTYPNRQELLHVLSRRLQDPEKMKLLSSTIDHPVPLAFSFKDHLKSDQKWYLMRVVPFTVPSVTKVTYVMISIHDVSDPFAKAELLDKQYELLSDFINFMPLGLLYMDRRHKIVGANHTFSQWIGSTQEDLIGQSLDNFQTKNTKNILSLRSLTGEIINVVKFSPPEEPSGVHTFILCRLDPQMMEGLQEGGRVYDLSFSDSPIPAVILSKDMQILSTNSAFLRMMSERSQQASSKGVAVAGDRFVNLVHPDVRPEVMNQLQQALDSQKILQTFEIRFDGDKFHTTAYVNRVNRPGEKPMIKIQFVDISEQKRLERQFIQSQKMQAVGQLAGGIAHDFNNLLTAMIGFCDLLLQRHMPSDPSYGDVIQIKQNAARAANLVRQLLAFSRQQTLQPKVLSLTDILVELSALLQRLIGVDIDFEMIHGRDIWPVHVDASQIEQVIINLVVNGRDAMAGGGKLIVRSSNYKCLKEQRLWHDFMPPGDYVLIEVCDTGCGIAPEHMDHIFEPFFSTKEVGSGTGLGLSTVYGIIKQTGGFVWLDSKVGRGTTFKVFLPRYKGYTVPQKKESMEMSGDLTGAGLILLVEDEDAVRQFSARALREKGYRVVEAESGVEAMEILQKGEKPDLLLTDVVMPKMDGPTLGKKVLEMLPETRIIFISGYTEDAFRSSFDEATQINFLPKPYTLKELASKVKEVLNRKN